MILTSRGAAIEWSNAYGVTAGGGAVGVGAGVIGRQRSGWSVLGRRTPIRWARLVYGAAPGDTTRPTLVGSITVGVVTTTSIAITWPAGADNVAVTSYEVSNTGGSSWTDTGSTSTGYTFTGLSSGTTYALRVRAKDTAGNVSTPALAATQSTTALTGNSRPVVDISAGGWTPSTGVSLYACIDESTEDDSDYIKCTASATIETAIFSILPTLPAGTHTRRFAASVTSGAAQIRLALLDDSNTVLGVSAWIAVTNSVAVYSAAITITGTATRARIEGQAA